MITKINKIFKKKQLVEQEKVCEDRLKRIYNSIIRFKELPSGSNHDKYNEYYDLLVPFILKYEKDEVN